MAGDENNASGANPLHPARFSSLVNPDGLLGGFSRVPDFPIEFRRLDRG
jgi:hypothetical protein